VFQLLAARVLMSDLNNPEVANILFEFLKKLKLD